MSSFKRRVPAGPAAPLARATAGAGAGAALPVGVRPSPTSSLPQPLLSSGIAAVDDLVAGRGIPSGTMLLVLPEDYTQPLTTARAASLSAGAHQLDPWTLTAAEPYTDLVLAYGIAQGIAHRHINIVVGERAADFCQSLMARVGDEEDTSALSALSRTTAQTSGQGGSGAGAEDLKIAFRYANLPVLNSGGSEADEPGPSRAQGQPAPAAADEFPSTFDLSRRISPRVLEKAREGAYLRCIDLDPLLRDSSQSVFEHVLAQIRAIVETAKTEAQGKTAPPPVLRIHIRALGSPAWQQDFDPRSTAAFVLRLKKLLRDLAVPTSISSAAEASTRATTLHAIATMTLSPHALTGGAEQDSSPVDVAHRMCSLADTALALSSFDARPSLRHLLAPPPPSKSSSSRTSATASKSAHGYTGAIRVLLSAAAIGGWPNEMVRASVLRGMSASASASSAQQAGGGAGENDLAFRVGRKRLTVELLNVDDIGLARREAEDGRDAAGGGGNGSEDVLRRMEELRVKEEGLRAAAKAATASTTSAPSSKAAASPGTSQPSKALKSSASSSQPASPLPEEAQPNPALRQVSDGIKLGAGGLASLRARGLAARASSCSATATNKTSTPTPIAVELEHEGQGHDASGGAAVRANQSAPTRPARPLVFDKKPQELEF